MRFYWVHDSVNQQQFHVYWKPGCENDADYFTKHHTAAHHQRMRPLYLHQSNHARTHCKGVLIPKANAIGLIAPVRTERPRHGKTVTFAHAHEASHTQTTSTHRTP